MTTEKPDHGKDEASASAEQTSDTTVPGTVGNHRLADALVEDGAEPAASVAAPPRMTGQHVDEIVPDQQTLADDCVDGGLQPKPRDNCRQVEHRPRNAGHGNRFTLGAVNLIEPAQVMHRRV